MDARKYRIQSASPLSAERRAVMFVDIEGSTQMKYRDGKKDSPELAARIIRRLVETVDRESRGRHDKKFTGDGAMVTFEVASDHNGCHEALLAAERIILRHDRENLRFEAPPIHIRIGIATGDCYPIGDEISGPAADLAQRLCSEAEREGVLMDDETRRSSALPAHRFAESRKRLSLKGVPPMTPNDAAPSSEDAPRPAERFYTLQVNRLFRPSRRDHFEKGLIAIYSDRHELTRDFSIPRLLYLAVPESTILVAGRTLRFWLRYDTEVRSVARRNGVCFKFLLSSHEACNYLVDSQRATAQNDLKITKPYFKRLRQLDPVHFKVRESPQLILDALTCASIRLPDLGRHLTKTSKLVVQQDLNASPNEFLEMATAIWGCTCGDDVFNPLDPPRRDGRAAPAKHECNAFGFYERALKLFDDVRPIL